MTVTKPYLAFVVSMVVPLAALAFTTVNMDMTISTASIAQA